MSLVTMTDPIERDARWFVEVNIRWFVDGLAGWISEPVFRRARPLRRAMESEEKPFEATLYLEYVDHHWRLWQPE